MVKRMLPCFIAYKISEKSITGCADGVGRRGRRWMKGVSEGFDGNDAKGKS
jgi:hypothetical protein